ncbi:MAG TPA: hypothetical protein VMS31_20570, partial [Pyrinomonadaceae bacterium]|nr:hypothetical protein [Pyrinomonadaceae bacterium]
MKSTISHPLSVVGRPSPVVTGPSSVVRHRRYRSVVSSPSPARDTHHSSLITHHSSLITHHSSL